MNVVLVQGAVTRAPEAWPVAGGEVLGFDVTVRQEAGPAAAVPVRWENPPAWAAQLAEGDEVLVTGKVRRRFFRAGGGTQSRTEVVAGAVVRVRPGRRSRTAMDEAITAALAGAGLATPAPSS